MNVMNDNDLIWNRKEMETLVILQEECSEVSQAISKCFRFGKDGEWDGTTNKRRLEAEIGDVLAMIDILVENCYISDSEINASRKAKKEKLKKWSKIYDTTRTSTEIEIDSGMDTSRFYSQDAD
jgi:NTP pyrophosphatase (non-canonical NTP hydrolase)